MRTYAVLFAAVCIILAPALLPAAETPVVGIGMKFRPIESYDSTEADVRLKDLKVEVKIIAILQGGPAEKAGIRIGDPLLRVEDGGRVVHVKRATVNDAQLLISGGAPGTKVRIVVGRRDKNSYLFLREKVIEVVRDTLDPAWFATPVETYGGMY